MWMRSTSRLIGRYRRFVPTATGRALFGSIIGSVPGVLLPFAIAIKMHVGRLTDAYTFSFGIALFAAALLVGVLQANCVPVFQRLKVSGARPFRQAVARTAKQTLAVALGVYARTAAP